MERALRQLDQERRLIGRNGPLPCNRLGAPTGA
jgi:hypothetical protein